MDKFMEMAIEEAYEGIRNGDGGPFGAVIVKDGKVIGKGHNRVLKNQDPTCHGEVEAIRDACKNIKNFDLKGSTIYTTGVSILSLIILSLHFPRQIYEYEHLLSC